MLPPLAVPILSFRASGFDLDPETYRMIAQAGCACYISLPPSLRSAGGVGVEEAQPTGTERRQHESILMRVRLTHQVMRTHHLLRQSTGQGT